MIGRGFRPGCIAALNLTAQRRVLTVGGGRVSGSWRRAELLACFDRNITEASILKLLTDETNAMVAMRRRSKKNGGSQRALAAPPSVKVRPDPLFEFTLRNEQFHAVLGGPRLTAFDNRHWRGGHHRSSRWRPLKDM